MVLIANIKNKKIFKCILNKKKIIIIKVSIMLFIQIQRIILIV